MVVFHMFEVSHTIVSTMTKKTTARSGVLFPHLEGMASLKPAVWGSIGSFSCKITPPLSATAVGSETISEKVKRKVG